MILARTESDWLKQFLPENGRAMTVSVQTMVID
jgi:hypothetical protein